ncbi:hypothetical protein FZ983_32315 [Azospirillum sp. B21]|uniref:hypothetical protein n=1 Tax=Azospirillum sp. B21 TaxID=2607496 RepID=UPI0011EF97AC|nr:hypothetical protein [Azospirillum sp. B21]KAA0572257.1 hypothetical protein FZ983_32315 [Azospirillum sp. B21]
MSADLTKPTCTFCGKVIRGHAMQCNGPGNFAHNACFDKAAAPKGVEYYRKLITGEITWTGAPAAYPIPARLTNEQRRRFRRDLRLCGLPTDEARAETDAAYHDRYRKAMEKRRNAA